MRRIHLLWRLAAVTALLIVSLIAGCSDIDPYL